MVNVINYYAGPLVLHHSHKLEHSKMHSEDKHNQRNTRTQQGLVGLRLAHTKVDARAEVVEAVEEILDFFH